MPKASTFGALIASQVVDSDCIPIITNAGDNKKLPVSEARNAIGPGWSATVNAYNEVGATDELKIQAAITRASGTGATRVFVPTSMVPYDASLVAFDTAIRMVREGGDFSVWDVQAYGATGDGLADDTLALQAALDGAVVSGGDVVLPDGTYLIDTMLTVGSYVFMRGSGMRLTTIKQAAAANLVKMIQSITNVIGSRFEGFTLDGNAANNTAAGQNHMLSIDYATDCLIRRLEVKNFYGLVGGTGVGIAGSGVCTRVCVDECYVHDLGDIGELRQSDGIFIGGTRNKITNCTVENVTDTAIVMENSTDPLCTGNSLTDNVQGIAVGSASGLDNFGGVVANNTITGTNRYNGQSIVIYRLTGAANSKVIVANNIVRDSTAGAGIFVWRSSYVTLTGNIVSNCGGTAAEARDGTGIYIRNSDHVSASGGQVNGCAAQGIQVAGCTDLTLGPILVYDNVTFSAGSSAGVTFADGPTEIYGTPEEVECARVTVFGLRSFGATQGLGLLLSGLCDDFMIVGCDLRGNANNPGYSSTATGNVRRFANLVYDNANAFEVFDYANLNGGCTVTNGDVTFTSGAGASILNVSRIRSDTTNFAFNNNANTQNNWILDDASGSSEARGTSKATGFVVGANQVVGARDAAVADAAGGATVDAEARTALNALLARLRTHGLIAT